MIEEGTNVYVNHCVYIEIRWEEGVLMIRFIFHLNKAFPLLQKHLATNTFYYKSSCDFLPKTTLYNVSFFFFLRRNESQNGCTVCKFQYLTKRLGSMMVLPPPANYFF